MKVLLVHNYYKESGGEDAVVDSERDILEKNNIYVSLLVVRNAFIQGFFCRVRVALGTIFSLRKYFQIREELLNINPDLVHVHNYFPLLSPAVFFACKSVGVPVVHTLHNYRAICPTALLMYGREIEERSLSGSPWWGISKKVYRGSLIGTLILALMIFIHRSLGTWSKNVDRFIALSEFSREKYLQAGWPQKKMAVKPNFVVDPCVDGFTYSDKRYAVYVGRLSEEKGIDIILNAWKDIDFPLIIIGDGPFSSMVIQASGQKINYVGKRSKEQVLKYIAEATVLVMASTCYEGFPMVLVEAFACGTATLVPCLGSMQEIVDYGVTGLHFKPGDCADLKEKACELINNPALTRQMGLKARKKYEDNFTPEVNFKQLLTIYKDAIAEAQSNAS